MFITLDFSVVVDRRQALAQTVTTKSPTLLLKTRNDEICLTSLFRGGEGLVEAECTAHASEGLRVKIQGAMYFLLLG
jgi:hypothetical protein